MPQRAVVVTGAGGAGCGRPTHVLASALLLCSSVFAQSDIKIGEIDPPPPEGPKGYRTCVPSEAGAACSFVFGYSVIGPDTVVVLSEPKRRLASGRSESEVIDVVAVPREFQSTLRIHCRYRGVVDYALLAAVEFTGEPDVWLGPARWAVGVDLESKKIVGRDPAFVECYFERAVE